MEGGPKPNTASLENAPQPDLLEAFANREVTVFGITGTFKDLAGMCPVDLSNPSITLEAKNSFVVKAANEAGIAIEPEHEAVFTRITEQHGLERKFTIAAPVNTTLAETKPVTEPTTPTQQESAVISTPKLQQKPATTPAAVEARAPNRLEQLEQQRQLALEVMITTPNESSKTDTPAHFIEQPAQPDIAPLTTGETHTVKVRNQSLIGRIINEAQTRPLIPDIRPTVTMAIQKPVAETSAGMLMPFGDFTPVTATGFTNKVEVVPDPIELTANISVIDGLDALSALPEMEMSESTLVEDAHLDELWGTSEEKSNLIPTSAETMISILTDEIDMIATLPDLTMEEDLVDNAALNELWGILQPEDIPEAQPVVFQEEIEFAVIDWAAELSKEPQDVYEDFTETLRSITELVTLSPAKDKADELTVVHLELESSESKQTEPIPAIITAVAERLTVLEPPQKELVAPILKDIIGAIHGIQLLETKESDPETIAAVEVQLEELCITLFEAVGIEYNEQDIMQFIRIMLYSPEFRPPQALEVEQELDLEHMGTREVKGRFPQLTGSLTSITSQLQYALGVFALLCAN